MNKSILVITLMLAACSSTKQPAGSASHASSDSTAARTLADSSGSSYRKEGESPYEERFRLVVSLICQGAGADAKALEQVKSYLYSYESWSGKKIEYEKTPWGKEGEVDYCMKLANLDAQAQKDFVTQVREVMLMSQLVHI